jgi:hypothetical protein
VKKWEKSLILIILELFAKTTVGWMFEAIRRSRRF